MSDPAQEFEPGKRLVRYLTIDEVATMLRVSEKTIYRLSKADPTFPRLKLGGTVLFPQERLERWLRDREQGPRMRRQVLSVAKGASEKESDNA